MYGDPSDEAIAAHQDQIAADALAAARELASEWLADGPGVGLAPARITSTLLARDPGDPQYQRLAPFEKRWSTMTIRLLLRVMDPTPAVVDAHSRGASWADIGNALGISRVTAFKRYSAND
ncbi:hypothetical protein [Mycolicibacterium insubricum]|uniref:hypothetical protein n=1 Tax=Mycolicibacterium insubricum TaxID=444597 RepID=UPI001055E0D0|nr:hypothetical protein [Mycolicibacterium insubricum]MCV7080131.1 hypothetical protein [Mycolicibacterium insubricum]